MTLHNLALANMQRDPTAGFRKLNFLLSSPPFPKETFANLLLLYCKPQHPFHDLAADVMAENPEYVGSLLDKVGRKSPRWVACSGSRTQGSSLSCSSTCLLTKPAPCSICCGDHCNS